MEEQVTFKIQEKSKINLLFGFCWLVYFSTYLGRLNYSAGLTAIIGAEGFSKGEAGLIGTGFFFAYGVGQFLSGFLGDKLSPKKLVFTGMVVSGFVNLTMAFLNTSIAMAVVWCMNGLAQALIWSPMIRLMFEYYTTEQRQKSCVYLNSSVPVGTMAAYGMTAGIIYLSNWRTVFIVSAVILLSISAIWFIGISKIESYVMGLGGPSLDQINKKTSSKTEAGQIKWIPMLVKSGLLFLMIALLVQGALKDGVTTWVPTYISETYGLSPILSITSTMVIPVFNLLGVYLASMVNLKWLHDEIKTAGAFFVFCTISLLILWLFSDKSILVSFMMLAFSTTAMMAVNTMLIAVLPSYFGVIGRASSVSGLLNSSVYAGGALSTYGIGALSVAVGWNLTILCWVFCALLGAVICGFIWKRWRSYRKQYLL